MRRAGVGKVTEKPLVIYKKQQKQKRWMLLLVMNDDKRIKIPSESY